MVGGRLPKTYPNCFTSCLPKLSGGGENTPRPKPHLVGNQQKNYPTIRKQTRKRKELRLRRGTSHRQGCNTTSVQIEAWHLHPSYGTSYCTSHGWVGIYTTHEKSQCEVSSMTTAKSRYCASDVATIIILVTHKNTSFPTLYGHWKPYHIIKHWRDKTEGPTGCGDLRKVLYAQCPRLDSNSHAYAYEPKTQPMRPQRPICTRILLTLAAVYLVVTALDSLHWAKVQLHNIS